MTHNCYLFCISRNAVHQYFIALSVGRVTNNSQLPANILYHKRACVVKHEIALLFHSKSAMFQYFQPTINTPFPLLSSVCWIYKIFHSVSLLQFILSCACIKYSILSVSEYGEYPIGFSAFCAPISCGSGS